MLMVTCFLTYQIDPHKVEDFEHYAKTWIDLVNKMGGDHHGYLLPYEGASNVAYASFSFPSLAEYERYRNNILRDKACQDILNWEKEKRCIISYERSFMSPVFKELKVETK